MADCDVVIVGAGPAGAIAGLVLARAGVRVRIFDRATFPRDKLCGDTVNPGTLATLRRLGVSGDVEARGLRLGGMLVTGDGGVAVDGRYPDGVEGRAILRRDLDWILLQQAVAAGCQFDAGVSVREAIAAESSGATTVHGVSVGGGRTIRAPITIAADGRRSTLAFGLGLARHPHHPRRWAIGAYMSGVSPQTLAHSPEAETVAVGEMHVRETCYIGVAPLPGGLTNVCLVRPSSAGDAGFGDPDELLRSALSADPLLRDRFAVARQVTPTVVLGPLAVDVTPRPIDGLILAGDAAGFIDPMTGDGLRFATVGGELAAHAALAALEHGWDTVHETLARDRARVFGAKWRFNRAVRAMAASPRSVGAAAMGARIAPALVRAAMRYAGDCHLAR